MVLTLVGGFSRSCLTCPLFPNPLEMRIRQVTPKCCSTGLIKVSNNSRLMIVWISRDRRKSWTNREFGTKVVSKTKNSEGLFSKKERQVIQILDFKCSKRRIDEILPLFLVKIWINESPPILTSNYSELNCRKKFLSIGLCQKPLIFVFHFLHKNVSLLRAGAHVLLFSRT